MEVLNMKKKWIIFDVMGVIFKVGDDTNDLLLPYVQTIDANNSREKINEIYMEASLGKITSCELWKQLNCATDNTYKEIEKKYLDEYLTLDEEFLGAASRLKENYNIAILSNDVSEWSVYLREKYRINEFVEFSIISGDVGYRKPSEDIYKLALEKIGVEPSDCVFVDDRDKNLKPALQLGMKVIRFLRDDMECSIDKAIVVKNFKELEEQIINVWKNEQENVAEF